MLNASITFKFDTENKSVDYSARKQKLLNSESYYKPKQILNGKQFCDLNFDTIVTDSNYETNIIYPQLNNGLLNTIFESYCNHVPLKLSPDNIWISIVISLCKYINNNSEFFRDKIVNHKGTEKILIKRDNFDNISTELLGITNEIMDQIKEKTKGDIVEWITPKFSTTTEKDKLVANIALMSGLRKFFSYGGMGCCGLTEVTLEGTISDWQELIAKAKKMYEFNNPVLNSWTDLLIPVLEEFCNAYQGNVNENFWQRICTYVERGSGGEKNFRGWFVVFSPFSSTGEYILRDFDKVQEDNMYADIEDEEIGDCAIDVDFTITDSVGQNHSLVLFGGILFTKYDFDHSLLSTSSDYFIIKSKYIDYPTMKSRYYDLIKQYSILFSKEQEEAGTYEKVIKFMHFIASKSNIPNNMLLNLVDDTSQYLYYSKRDEIPTNDSIYNRCYKLLLSGR